MVDRRFTVLKATGTIQSRTFSLLVCFKELKNYNIEDNNLPVVLYACETWSPDIKGGTQTEDRYPERYLSLIPP
jgi:hypothetical protein